MYATNGVTFDLMKLSSQLYDNDGGVKRLSTMYDIHFVFHFIIGMRISSCNYHGCPEQLSRTANTRKWVTASFRLRVGLRVHVPSICHRLSLLADLGFNPYKDY